MLPILIINSAPFTDEFVKPIIETYTINNIPHCLISYTNIPTTFDDYSGVIISASPRGDDIIDEQIPLYQWLKTINKPVLGSCHGHQLMGILFESELIIGHESEEGMHPLSMKGYDELLIGLPGKNWMVEQHHVKSISIPENFDVLASSERCINQIMKHANMPLYGCQFHVESQPELLLNFATICNALAINDIINEALGKCKI